VEQKLQNRVHIAEGIRLIPQTGESSCRRSRRGRDVVVEKSHVDCQSRPVPHFGGDGDDDIAGWRLAGQVEALGCEAARNSRMGCLNNEQE
jgi:hypothetical protein